MFESSVSMSSRYWRYIRATRSAIATKKAIVSAVSTTSSRLPPPGSTSKTSATRAMRPNFQAVRTTGTVSGLVDRAGRDEDEHDHAQRYAVHHEDERRMAREIAEQPGDRGVTHHERHQRRYRQRAQAHLRVIRPVQDRGELEQPAQDHRRHGQEEGEARRAR